MKKIKIILSVLVLLISTTASAHYIGEQYEGGIIFWVDEDAEHGLIAATEDVSSDLPWFSGTYVVTSAIRDGIFAGKDNTNRIIEVQGSTVIYAASTAIGYKASGYTDWYLPSRYELNLMFIQKNMISEFANHNYWSSTEYVPGPVFGAYIQNFGNGDQLVELKENLGHVRLIRSF